MKMTEIGEILNEKQLEEIEKAGLDDKIALRAISDEELVKTPGIGLATAQKLRDWSVFDVPEGDAISLRCLVFADEDGEQITILPGDIIPAKYDAARAVEKGQATWR